MTATSTRRPGTRRAASAAIAALAIGGLVSSAGPAAAIPFEGTPDPSRCEQLLTRAEAWPSTRSDDLRFVSDGYVLYLATSPECADPRS